MLSTTTTTKSSPTSPRQKHKHTPHNHKKILVRAAPQHRPNEPEDTLPKDLAHALQNAETLFADIRIQFPGGGPDFRLLTIAPSKAILFRDPTNICLLDEWGEEINEERGVCIKIHEGVEREAVEKLVSSAYEGTGGLMDLTCSNAYSDVCVDVFPSPFSSSSSPPQPPKQQQLQSPHQSPPQKDLPYHLHKFLLATRIPYFHALLTSPYLDSSSPTHTLPTHIIPPHALHTIITHVYGGTVPPARTLDEALSRHAAAEYLGVTAVSARSLRDVYAVLHNLCCVCEGCVASIPRVVEYARDRGLEALETDCVDLVVRGWDRCIPTKRFAGDTPPEFRDRVCEGVVESIRVGTIVETITKCTRAVTKLHGVPGGSPWVATVTDIITRIKHRTTEIISTQFPHLAQTELTARVESDTLDEILDVAIANLKERNAVDVLKGLVWLDWSVGGEAVSRARVKCVRFIALRWVSLRLGGGFEGIEKDILKEIAD
ncbi:hypothetical protein HK104_003816, partial [Borealophlyctis nickersoniae]